jgi:hypothetical protein
MFTFSRIVCRKHDSPKISVQGKTSFWRKPKFVLFHFIFLTETAVALYLYIGWCAVAQWYSDWLRARRPRCRSSSPGRVKNFIFSTASRGTLWPTQPPSQWVPRAVSPQIKRPGREADRSPPTTALVTKTWIYTSTHHVFMVQCFISKHKYNFTIFLFPYLKKYM